MAQAGLVEGPDGITRCAWHGNLPDYLRYHDHEWGRPVADDRRLFEKICLEGFPVRSLLADNPQEAREFSRRLRQFRVRQGSPNSPRPTSSGCCRTPASSAIAARSSRRSTTLAARRKWSRRPARSPPGSGASSRVRKSGRRRSTSRICAPIRPPRFPSRISKELKKRGWTFVGPTTVYAFMQAMGLVNDHIEGCYCRAEIEKERARFKRPK